MYVEGVTVRYARSAQLLTARNVAASKHSPTAAFSLFSSVGAPRFGVTCLDVIQSDS